VEAARVGEESAFAHIGGAVALGVRVVEGLQVPAAVGGEGGDPVGAGRDQLPQVFRRADPAGEAAPHRDDRHRVLVPRRGAWGGRYGGAVPRRPPPPPPPPGGGGRAGGGGGPLTRRP